MRVRRLFAGRRGTARLGVLLAAAAVAAGMTLGTGVASTRTSSGYDLAWLTDSGRGQLVQVDPVVGRANVRLQVADPGSSLSIQQGNGQLVVVDRKTGKITSIDLGTLLVGGSRTERAGDGVKVLLAGSRLYVADLPRGTIRAVDPATQASIGTPWSAGRPLVDFGVDGARDVWALDSGQHLIRLRWGGATLAPVTTRTVEGAGPGSVIVGHDRGITLIGARGAIVRVGTGRDARLDAPNINGPLHGPLHSPDGLVPVSDPGTSSVVIVGPRDAVVDDVSGYGCARPLAPTVFDGKVYVPCGGASKVLVLDVDGKQVGAAIPVPRGGDPQLTVSGGRLVIDVPGSGRATVVDASGRARDFPTVAPGVGVQNPNTPAPAPPDPPKPTPTKKNGDRGHQNDPGRDGPRGTSGGRGNAPSGGPAGGGDAPSVGATAQARPDGTVLISWSASSGAGTTVVTATSTGGQVATVPAGATSATVTVLDPGTTTAFQVRNSKVDATTNSVTTAATPGSVTGVSVTSQGVSGGVATLAVTWGAAAANGAQVSYAVTASGATTRTTANLNATITVPCASGCSGTVTVTARNSAGAGAPVRGSFDIAVPSAPGTQAPPQTQAPAPEPTTQAPPATQAPAPVAMPGAGADLLTTSATIGSDTAGTAATATVTFNPTADWAAFSGSCDLYVDGAKAEGLPCNAGGWARTYDYGESGTHEFVVRATDPATGRTVDSATKSQNVVYRQLCLNGAGARQLAGAGSAPLQRPICDQPPTCPGCNIPFVSPRVGWADADRPAARPATRVELPGWFA